MRTDSTSNVTTHRYTPTNQFFFMCCTKLFYFRIPNVRMGGGSFAKNVETPRYPQVQISVCSGGSHMGVSTNTGERRNRVEEIDVCCMYVSEGSLRIGRFARLPFRDGRCRYPFLFYSRQQAHSSEEATYTSSGHGVTAVGTTGVHSCRNNTGERSRGEKHCIVVRKYTAVFT